MKTVDRPKRAFIGRSKTVLLINLLLVLFFASSSFAEIYYVTEAGAGARDGKSSSNAWSVSDFNTSSNWSATDDLDRIDPGDTVDFSGTISTAPVSQGDGTSGNIITIDGDSATITSGFDFNGKDYITMSGFTFTGSGIPLPSPCDTGYIDATGTSQYITITNTQATGASQGSCVIRVKYGNYVTIENNDWQGFYTGIATAQSDNVTIRNNTLITLSGPDDDDQADIIRDEGGIGFVIEGNKMIAKVTGSRHNDIMQFFKGGGARNPSNWTIRYNWIQTDNGGDTSDVSWFMFEQMDGYLKIYTNVFLGSGGGGNGASITRQATEYTLYFYNNTMVGKPVPGNMIDFWDTLENATRYLKNNIFYDNGSKDIIDGHSSTSITRGTNSFYGGRTSGYLGTSCENFRDSSSTCDQDPLFADYTNNNFSLTESSPVKSSGTDLGSEYNKRVAAGATWPNPTLNTASSTPSIGAYSGTVDSIAPNPPVLQTPE